MKEIESSAFEGCAALRRVYIPRSLTRFNAAAFSGAGVREVHITDLAAWCESYFSYATANPLGCGADLYLNGEQTPLHSGATLYVGGVPAVDLVIPDGVTRSSVVGS